MANGNGTKQIANFDKSDRRTDLVIVMTIFVPLIQFIALVLLPVFFPAISVVAWSILLLFLILTLAMSILVNFVIRKGAIQVRELPEEPLNISDEPINQRTLRDPITNLFNRNYLEATLERELHRSLRGQKTIGVIRLEVDGFERIIETYGDSVSDTLLKKIASYLRESIRVSDIACRLDHQEFVLVMSGVSRDLTVERAEHIRGNASNIKLKYEDQTIDGITFSLGVAVFPEHGTTVETLLENTEIALSRARADGANRVVVYQKNLE